MSFTFVPRGTWQAGEPLRPGQCALNADGRLLVRAEDLAAVKIERAAAVLADPSTLRLAIRRPRGEAEVAGAMQVCWFTRKGGAATGRCGINAARAIRLLALTPATCKGRYELVGKDDLLILSLAGISAAGKTKGAQK